MKIVPFSTLLFALHILRRNKAPHVPNAQPSSAKGASATSSTAAPDASPVQAGLAPERTTGKSTATPSSSGKGTLDDNADQQAKKTPHARSPSLLKGIDLYDIDRSTLTSCFQVGHHVSLLLFVVLMCGILSGARLALPIGVAPESMFGYMQSSLDLILVFYP